MSTTSGSAQENSPPNLSSVGIDPRYLITREVVERPPAERPMHDTLDEIADWLIDGAPFRSCRRHRSSMSLPGGS
jgi:hypothetical protein